MSEESYKSGGVNHPKHYNEDASGVECIEVVRHRNFNVGNAIKYLWRCGLKDGENTVKDLEKAKWYINDELKRLADFSNTLKGDFDIDEEERKFGQGDKEERLGF
jgi:hypothetical protein